LVITLGRDSHAQIDRGGGGIKARRGLQIRGIIFLALAYVSIHEIRAFFASLKPMLIIWRGLGIATLND
jgi:hypothetical protein